MSYSWFREGSCTVGASDVVRFQSANITTAPNKPVVGDAFTVGGFRFYEIIFIGSDATGEYIRLNRAYEEAAGSNISYAIARFASGTQNAKLVAMASAAINQKQISLDDMYEWYTSQADTVQFLGPDGTFTTLTTYYKLSQEVTAVGGNAGAITVVANNIANVNAVATNIDDVKDAKNQADRAKSEADRAAASADLSFAMSQAQFEVIREQNKGRYAASGWVSFGNHESGKQVNECKSGLYTALTTPNTLLIGKSGGAGGSKTDYASVHIDGVVFNLTNQFVLTLPSHPTSVLPERMDMYGVESEKVEISSASPNAYQGGLRGVGAAVNLFTATEQQKKDFFAQNSNTTFIGSDGKIYQWQLYKIKFAGTTGGVPSPTEQGYSLNSFGDLWLKAGKNLLYFGNVLRLNDGGYHPSFNPLGAAKFVGDTFWYNTTASITSRSDCFNPSKLLAGSGSIASGKSGRPDERHYDAIYADGFGGVCRDMRYSSNGVDLVDFTEVDQQVKIGTYRGYDNRFFTKIVNEKPQNTSNPTSEALFVNDPSIYKIGDYVSIFQNGVVECSQCRINAISGSMVSWLKVYGTFNRQAGVSPTVIHSAQLPSSVGGSFLQTDVIGSPANILATPALANGWAGKWISQIPNGILDEFFLSKQCIVAGSVAVTYTTNNGSNWGMTGAAQNVSSTAIIYTNLSANQINILTYVASANPTEQANNAPIFSWLNGVGAVWVSNDNTPSYGSLFMQSLIGKVGTNRTVSPTGIYALPMVQYQIDGTTGLFYNNANYTNQHAPITNLGFFANSPAVKVLNYNVNINQQANIHYAYTELKHNGTNLGDDSKVTTINNQSTKTDQNGNTVLVGTAKLKEAIGWIKKKV